MRIGLVARVKQGDILEALKKRGWTQRQGAEFLGLDKNFFGKLINLRWVPKEFSDELTSKLLELTGKLPDELFPKFSRQEEFLSLSKVHTRIYDLTPRMLKSGAALFLPLPAPDEITNAHELTEKVDKVLKTLTTREEKVIQMCVMDGDSDEVVAQRFGVDHFRIRQIKAKALRKLRHPDRARELSSFVE